MRLKTEIEELKEKGINIADRLFISKSCHIITPECIEYDKNNNKWIGSRMIKRWISAPLMDLSWINSRLDAIEEL